MYLVIILILPKYLYRLFVFCSSMKLDLRDKKILILLSENSRISNSEIADLIKISRESIGYRIKKLSDEKIINNFYPDIDFRALGFRKFRIFFLLDENKLSLQQEFIQELINHKNTCNLIEYSDRWNLEWVLVAKNIDELDDIKSKILEKYSNVIIEYRSFLTLRDFPSLMFPYEINISAVAKKIKERQFNFDIKDIKILCELSKNARYSTYDIAKTTGFSSDTVRLRINKMVENRLIKKFTIKPNIVKLNFLFNTFVIRSKTFNNNDETKFAEFVLHHKNIISAEKTYGDWNILIYTVVEHQNDFHSTIKEIKALFGNIIGNYDTYIAYKEHIFVPFPKAIIEHFIPS